jgi:hypothetical protein
MSGGRWAKKVPEKIYFIGKDGDWVQGPYVNKPKGYKEEDERLRVFKLSEEGKDAKESKDDLEKENKILEEKIVSYEESFCELRKQFDEMNIFNAKICYCNKIYGSTELSISEKTEIARRFDEAESFDDSKKLYSELLEKYKK